MVAWAAAAGAAGVDESALEAADDAEDSKAALVALVLEHESAGNAAAQDGPAGPLLSALTAGGEAAAEAVSAALEHAVDVLEQLSMSSPRKSRRPILDLTDTIEELCESMADTWCDGLSACGADDLSALSDQLVSVQGLSAVQASASDAVSLVSDVVSSLRRCGSAAGQCASCLSAASDVDEAARLRVLECVRGLSCARLECVSADESAAFTAVCEHVLSRSSELSLSLIHI